MSGFCWRARSKSSRIVNLTSRQSSVGRFPTGITCRKICIEYYFGISSIKIVAYTAEEVPNSHVLMYL